MISIHCLNRILFLPSPQVWSRIADNDQKNTFSSTPNGNRALVLLPVHKICCPRIYKFFHMKSMILLEFVTTGAALESVQMKIITQDGLKTCQPLTNFPTIKGLFY